MAQPPVLKEFHQDDFRDLALVRTSDGACLRGCLNRTGQQVALKLLGRPCLVQSLERRFAQLREAAARNRVRSERILVPFGVFRARALVAAVLDWMDEGSLHALLYETCLYPDLPVQVRLHLLLDIAEGLCLLHAVSLPHGALRATSVLLDPEYRAKLCDWGQQTDVGVRTPACNGGVPCFRDLAYLAPEVVQGGAPSVKADMYSFGVLLWEVLTRRQPCEGVGHFQNLHLSSQEEIETQVQVNLLPLETPQCYVLTQLMIRCWSTEPERRPQSEECAAQLRKAVGAFESDAFTTAVHQLKACKERALLACKSCPVLVPVELNNVVGYGGCTGPKDLTSKEIPMNVACSDETGPNTGRSEMVPRGSSPISSAARASDLDSCCSDYPAVSMGTLTNRPAASRHCGGVCGAVGPRTPPSPHTPCVSPTTLFQAPRQHHSAAHQAGTPGSRSCGLLLTERRESIVRGMTEGRLNHLLDVLRARRAVSREDYEAITALLTLSARTRCLLDTCSCLGEGVAMLVATTLGLVSMETAPAQGCAGMVRLVR
ncbi:receptor-interacting serine/threonine-protein kinase 2 isoform X2 [Brachyhypopomus gauderio]